MKRFFILVSLAVLLFCSCEPTMIHIKYEVTGTADAVDITHGNADGGVSQLENVPVPWSTSFKRKNVGNYLPDSIMVYDEDMSGTIKVTIYQNGKKYKTDTGEFIVFVAGD